MGAPEGGVTSVVAGRPVGITMGVVEGSTLGGAVRETAGDIASFGAGGHATEVGSTSGGAVSRNSGAWGHATGVGDASSGVVLMNTGASTSSGAGWWGTSIGAVMMIGVEGASIGAGVGAEARGTSIGAGVTIGGTSASIGTGTLAGVDKMEGGLAVVMTENGTLGNREIHSPKALLL
jgi:hypothetical protein